MHRYWQSRTRYYRTDVIQDLFGAWLFIRRWGGRYNARGQEKTIPIESFRAGIQLTDHVAKTRIKHGYKEIPIGFVSKSGRFGMLPAQLGGHGAELDRIFSI